MSDLVFEAAFARGLGPLSARFAPGLHVVLGASPDDLATLAELASGVLPARRGRVLLAGDDVGRTPERRREIAALLRDEELPLARDVRTALARAKTIRGAAPQVDSALDASGLGELAAADPRGLSAAERRAVALALALDLEGVRLLPLWDPLGCALRAGPASVIEACRRRAASAIVLVLTPSLADALALGGTPWWLDRGRLERADAARAFPLATAGFVVRSRGARELSRELATDPDVELSFAPERAAFELSVRGRDLESLAVALGRAAAAAGVTIDELRPELPTLESALLARAGWLDPSYHPLPAVRP